MSSTQSPVCTPRRERRETERKSENRKLLKRASFAGAIIVLITIAFGVWANSVPRDDGAQAYITRVAVGVSALAFLGALTGLLSAILAKYRLLGVIANACIAAAAVLALVMTILG